MIKSVLLATAAVFALTAGASAAEHPAIGVTGVKTSSVIVHKAKGAKMLYNQNSNGTGTEIVSDNFTSGSFPSYDDQGADDFVVPKKTQWTVSEVDVTGGYFNGSGPATNVDVTFYKNSNGIPGAAVKGGTFTNLACTGSPNFACSLGKKGVKLKSGTYWVSVVGNMDFGGGAGEWGWELTSIHGDKAQWQNPGGGFGLCPTWGTVDACLGYSGDFMFDLQGVSKKKK